MTGMLEATLRKLYGEPSVVQSASFVEYRWSETDDPRRCVLYKPLKWDSELEHQFGVLKPAYGDAIGGSVLQGALKISMLRGPKTWGLYAIHELHDHPNILRALEFDPNVCYFMDAANVQYYGVKDGWLYEFDSDPLYEDELNVLGLVEPELKKLIQRWDVAGQ